MSRRNHSYYGGFGPYVSVAEKQASARKVVADLRKKGKTLNPIPAFTDRILARSFWGSSWCDNLESYADFMNRLPRGRSYLRHGCVCDLQIDRGEVRALVNGSDLYKVKIRIDPLSDDRKEKLAHLCRGKISSQLELLQGKIPKDVMKLVGNPKNGIFPFPEEIHPSCSCPDWATLCKHVCAVLYGIGRRLDSEPELIFTLRGVDPNLLVASAAELDFGTDDTEGNLAASENLGELFGIDLDLDMSAVDMALGADEGAQAAEKAAAGKSGQTRDEKAAAKKVAQGKEAKAPAKTAAKGKGEKATAKKVAKGKEAKAPAKKAAKGKDEKATAKKAAKGKDAEGFVMVLWERKPRNQDAAPVQTAARDQDSMAPVQTAARDLDAMATVQTAAEDQDAMATAQTAAEDLDAKATVQTAARDLDAMATVQTAARDQGAMPPAQTAARDLDEKATVQTAARDLDAMAAVQTAARDQDAMATVQTAARDREQEKAARTDNAASGAAPAGEIRPPFPSSNATSADLKRLLELSGLPLDRFAMRLKVTEPTVRRWLEKDGELSMRESSLKKVLSYQRKLLKSLGGKGK